MKKRIMGGLLSIALILNLSGCNISFGVDYDEKDMVGINKSIEYNGETKIDIEMKAGKVDISAYDGDEISIVGKVSKSSENIKVEKDGDRISIEDLSSSESNFNIFRKNNIVGVDIEIKIPKSFKGDIDLEYGAGEMSIHNLICKDIEVDGGAGRFNIENIVFEKLDYSGGVGETNIKLIEECGDINIDGGVGSINVDMSKVGGDFTFDGGVGSAKIRIPENAPVYFNTNSGIGGTKLKAKTSGENIYEFKIDVGVGEVEIYN